MRRPIVLGVTLTAAVAFAGLAFSALPLYFHPAELTEFGYVSSVTPKGSAYTLRFDPALWLEGETAKVASGQAVVPNDYLIVNRDRELLTYKLPASAHVTVLVNLQTTKVTVAKLAQLLKAKTRNACTPYQFRRPCRLGFWLTYRIDTVTALNQQYQP